MGDSARVLELKTALKERVEFMQKGLDSIEIEVKDDQTYVKGADAEAIRSAKEDAEEIKDLLIAEMFGAETKTWLDSPTTSSVAVQAAADAVNGNYSYKSLGEMFTESDTFKEFKASRRLTMPEPWMYEGRDITSLNEVKNVYGGMAGNAITRHMGNIQFDPLVPRGYRPNRVRDLFPVATTAANLIDFFRVTGWTEGSGDGNASPVVDYASNAFGAKPQSNLVFSNDQAPVRTIAHWEAAHRNVLDDVPQLQATINNELLYGLRLEEDYQILRGSGTGEDLLGILNTPNIQTYTAASATELKSDSLRRAATKVVIANYAATGYVLHPNDWEDIELQKGVAGTGGDGQYMLQTNVAIGLAAQMWRQPVVETVAMPEGTFLTGAFGFAAQLYDRQVANVRVAEQHSDFFIRNAVVILAEERLALACKRPEAFVKGTYGASSQ